ncbi:sorting nexin-1a [Syngnathoides biaculeatus]|uniref:sorting nexin-1a n=1 Tax=Syngnathoides biaculeatus TaxID=300417 RepID=UPI002ADDF45E|nr:sorting nexin-1a [Syngnathoides biaculeatus]XP_061679557.1 sorting nexin-1a [Syngnathoides biaculeatus]
MATSSERSPPPFPESGDATGRGSDEDDVDDLFMSVSDSSLSEVSSVSQPSDNLTTPPSDGASDPGGDLVRSGLGSKALSDNLTTPPSDVMSDLAGSSSGSKTPSEPSDEFDDLAGNWMSPVVSDASRSETRAGGENPLNDDFVDILGSETEPQQQEVEVGDASESRPDDCGDAKEDVKETSPLLDISLSVDPAPQPSTKIVDPLADLFDDPLPASGQKLRAATDLLEDEGVDLFADPRQIKSSKPPEKSLFDEPDEDLFGEPLGTKNKTAPKEPQAEPLADKTQSGGGGPLLDRNHGDVFAEEAVAPSNNSRLNSRTNGVHVEESADIFSEATVELSLDSPQNERKDAAAAAKPSSAAPAVPSATSVAKPPQAALEELDEEEESELEDKFDITISVTDPEKIGDGMTAYMAYKVSTQTTLSMFCNKKFTVRRRFSDFLGLYEKLSEKHAPNGLIVPPPPEKSILGMTKVKVGKEDSSSTDFVERRRGALERYLQRVVTHPSLLQDPDVREFLEREELPRAVSTQALSGAGFLKMINKATDAVSKMTIKMNESDVWFEEKLQEVESADQQFRKLHALVESLVIHRKELSMNTASFAKSAAMLGSAEDNTALSRALSQLAEVEDKMEQLHQDQAANDTFGFAELIADFIRLLGAVRGSFDHRMKAWQRWQDAQSTLQKKRETEAKLQWANKPDKLQLTKEEIVEWEAKVTQYERDFDRVSATVRKEVVRFEKEKARNFKRQIIKYLENLLKSQQQLIKYWEAFLPEAKAIA